LYGVIFFLPGPQLLSWSQSIAANTKLYCLVTQAVWCE